MKKKPKKEINEGSKKDDTGYPTFCFRWLQRSSYDKCKDAAFFIDFLGRLSKLGQLGWAEIYKSSRHSFGIEKIPVKQLRVQNLLPIFTREIEELYVFRATGSNLPFLGIREEDVFQVIFIETRFGDIYSH